MSHRALLNYDFIQLEQAAEKITDENEDVMYAVAHLHMAKSLRSAGTVICRGRCSMILLASGPAGTAPLVQELLG